MSGMDKEPFGSTVPKFPTGAFRLFYLILPGFTAPASTLSNQTLLLLFVCILVLQAKRVWSH